MKAKNLVKRIFRKGKAGATVLKGYWNDQSGQTSTEYILLIVVVVALISKFKAGLVGAIDPLINKIFGEEVNKLMGP